MVYPERPDDVGAAYCPSCETEMAFSGVQPAGLAQFFCTVCDYRYDRLLDS